MRDSRDQRLAAAVPAATRDKISRMLTIGFPVAVFVGPTSAAPTTS
jgi:hypothetical protein